MVSETCPNCTNGRVPGNDWTQPAVPCPECSCATTKVCETCDGTGATSQWDPKTCRWPRTECVDCKGTGRVPDVEAMLRAELDAARTDNARLRDVAEKQSRGRRAAMTGLLRMARRKVPPGPVAPPVPLDVQAAHEREVSELYATVASVTAERDAARAEVVRLALASVLGRGHEERDVVELAADVVQVVAESRGEVERLKSEVASLDLLARGERAMVDTANDVIADLRAKISECAALGLEALRRLGERDAEVARLTAEVEQLKAMTIEAVKGTSLTIIDAIGGTAQQTIEGRADVAAGNLAKLADRRARGVLAGSGNDR